MRKLFISLVLLCAAVTIIRAFDSIKQDAFPNTAAAAVVEDIPIKQ